MTLVNHQTGEIVETLTVEQARRLTDRIRLLGDSLADTLDKLAGLIDEARVGSAWLALGYRSWTEYVSTEFAAVLPRLDREPRQEFVRELASRGMSTRAIAPIVKASHETVAKDITAPVRKLTPQTSASESLGEGDNEADVDPESGADVEAPSPATNPPRPPVIGLDGKNYTIQPTKSKLDLAVEEFPDLSHYAETDRGADAVRLAAALRGYDDAERAVRLEALKATVAAERRGDLKPTAPVTTDRINKVINAYANGNSIASGTTFDELAEQAAHLNQLERSLGIGALTAAIDYATRLLDSLNGPTLRRIK